MVMINSRRAAALVVSLVLVGLALAVPASAVSPSPQAQLTTAQFDRLPFAQQEKLLEPLRAAADVLGAVGRGKYAATYSGLVLRPESGKVDLYLTDPGSLKSYLAEAGKAGSYDRRLVRAHRAPYSKRDLRAARARVLAKRSSFGFSVNSVAVPSEGTGLDIGVSGKKDARLADLAAPSKALTAVSKVPVAATHKGAGRFMSRWADTAPFYAGAYIKSSVGLKCSTGLPVHNPRTGRTYIVTAGHCGHDGVIHRTGNGGLVGTVISYDQEFDAGLIDARSLQREWDGPQDTTRWFDVQGSAYSFKGDSVCHDGYSSGVVCGIRVTKDDSSRFMCGKYYPCRWTRGVDGNTSSGTAAQGSDSGGLVFRVKNGKRQARGIISGGDEDDSTLAFWTEATDILASFGLKVD